MSAEDDKQEKTLAKLHWLIERTKPDFKGNPYQFEHAKTLKSVEKEREKRKNALAGETEFLPFHHSREPLAMTAVRQSYLKGCDNSKFEAIRQARMLERGKKNADTGLSEIQTALTWKEEAPVPYKFGEVTYVAPQKSTHHRLDAFTISNMTPGERVTAFREDMLAHPKHTFESASGHRDRWLSGSQLGELVEKPKQQRGKKLTAHRNAVRMSSY
ncbi:hypothetical protein AGDE_05214 [Angomonas deanei]|uniref:Uncharacterized protein n=1 Tax=Angomonas deanei TaxID=59799 RepID=A0A7G2CRM0_9TRYP|nr:hypothetical protein AGDE_05214 [Angomonas deanei]CAD2222009.1 hypothetical protein, conserved [Angomonas deanei]|eukprot:EPY38715.1 hypothetical protein AGDE_05214 [Angomonas deanei]